MSAESKHVIRPCTRRVFLQRTVAGAVSPLAVAACARAGQSNENRTATGSLGFRADGDAYQIDTGALQGTLRGEGKSRGMLPVVHSATGKNLARSLGLFSHYRLLDDTHRYGTAGWEWASKAQRRDDGSVAMAWSRDDAHPFDMRAIYRFSAPDTLDLTTEVVAGKDLKRFEVFLASYFDGFPQAYVYVKSSGQTAGKPGFHEARKEDAVWHIFPRDSASLKIIQDERWKRPPNPVEWTIMPELAAPLALRHDNDSGLCALIMARPEQCFAVAMPYGEESHRSVYLSLFGQDLRPGESAAAQTRLVIRPKLSDAEVVAAYREFLS